jgi:hypothetical protein
MNVQPTWLSGSGAESPIWAMQLLLNVLGKEHLLNHVSFGCNLLLVQALNLSRICSMFLQGHLVTMRLDRGNLSEQIFPK